jgi:hypothetical protein
MFAPRESQNASTHRQLAIALGIVLAGAPLLGCNPRVAECNRLVEAVRRHTGAIAAATEQLREIQSKPEVSDAFSATIKAANDELAMLELSDEKIAGFAKQYVEMLGEAEKVNQSMAAAASANDRVALDRAAAEAANVATLERNIVSGVNEYCQD